jgi:predicted alpha/beta-fold hydrolase
VQKKPFISPPVGAEPTMETKETVRTDRFYTGALATSWAFRADFVVYESELDPVHSRYGFSYPPPFRKQDIDTGQGAVLNSFVAEQREPHASPTVIIIPGMFNCTSQNLFVSLACRVYRNWRANVIIADMRGFGQTGRLCSAPTSVALKEPHDILALARWARRKWNCPDVFLLGLSLGGTMSLFAATRAAPNELSGCIAISSPIDVVGLIHRLSQPIWGMSSFTLFQIFYRWLLAEHCKLQHIPDIQDFDDYFDRVVAPYYGETVEGLFGRLDPLSKIDELRVPVLAFYAKDDPVVTAREPELLARAAETSGVSHLVDFRRTRTGGHLGQFALHREWCERQIKQFMVKRPESHRYHPNGPQRRGYRPRGGPTGPL